MSNEIEIYDLAENFFSEDYEELTLTGRMNKLEALLQRVHNESFNRGYNDGFKDTHKESYVNGFSEGFKAGFNSGIIHKGEKADGNNT